jgi:flagellar motor switch protein FliM
MEVELGRTIVSLRDLVTLQVGDVVLFDKPVNEPLLMTVNDREKYRVYPGVNKDRVAVQIASVVEDEE